MKDFSNYCSLDDSFFYANFKGLDLRVEFYISYMFHQKGNNGESLIIARPSKLNDAGLHELKDFVIEGAKDDKLVACQHYYQYKDWMEKEVDVEFVTKKIRAKPKYSTFKKTLFKNAHYGAYYTNLRLEYLFKSHHNKKSVKKTLKLFEDAVKNKRKKFSYSLEILIRGFD